MRAELGPGSLSQVAINLDRLLPSVRVGAFVSKGIKDSDVVGASTMLGIIHERVMHTVDTAGLNVQANIVPSLWWLDAHAELLKRYAPGVGNTAGGRSACHANFNRGWSASVKSTSTRASSAHTPSAR